jgi:hypothetical protein
MGSAERLRTRCIEQALGRRFALVARRRADVEAICAAAMHADADDVPAPATTRAGAGDSRRAARDDEFECDADLVRWLEQEVLDELRRREADDQAMCDAREAYEDEELAALLETHLGLD